MNIAIASVTFVAGILAGVGMASVYDEWIDDPSIRSAAAEICRTEKEGMISKADAAALQAKIDREREFRLAAEQARTEDAKRSAAANLRFQQRIAEFKASVASEADGGESVVTKEDEQWLARH